MVDRDTFYARLNGSCTLCEHWRGVCLKGHALASPLGCPLRKFAPLPGYDYAEDSPAQPPAPKVHECCGGNASMPPLTWGQVLASFVNSMAEWLRAGTPLVNSQQHGMRYEQCKSCDQYRGFYCGQCKCVAYLKTKLATEQCPLASPRWVSAIYRDE